MGVFEVVQVDPHMGGSRSLPAAELALLSLAGSAGRGCGFSLTASLNTR
jgi:hypothetical protein